jgi:hypothetical protein
MSWNQADLLKRVDELTQVSENQLVDKQSILNDSIDSARERYSTDKPKNYVWTRSGNGDAYYDFPSAFDPDFSIVQSVERPTGGTPKTFLDPKQYELYENDGVTWQFGFLNGAPDSSVEFRITFTTVRTIAQVGAAHKQAFAFLAAHFVCNSVAAALANQEQSSIAQDTVDNETGSSTWENRAKSFFGKYAGIVLPKKKEEVKAAEVTSEVTSLFAGRTPRVWHRD